MNQFTIEELNNLGLLINKANITGKESVITALLIQKIQNLLTPIPEEPKKDLPKEENKV